MDEKEFTGYFWDYYLTLESDLLKLQPYVAFDKANYNCFSNQLIKLFLSIGSEIDVICKEYAGYLCRNRNIKKSPKSIKEYSEYILFNNDAIINENVNCTISNDKLSPWKNWSRQTPEWWKQYNNVKHNRIYKDNYKKANLGNVIMSLSALYIIEKYYYRELENEHSEVSKGIILLPSHLQSQLFGYISFEYDQLVIGV